MFLYGKMVLYNQKTAQPRLKNMWIFLVEQDLASNVDLDQVIEEFKNMLPFKGRMFL